MSNKLSKEIVNQRIFHRNMELIGEYISTSNKTMFKCHKNHTWLAKPNNVMARHSGCPECDGQKPLTKNVINSRIRHKNIKMIGEYVNVDTKSMFQCNDCNAIFSVNPYLIMTKSYCPECHKRSGGFKKHKPGTLYILLFSDYNCIKYGVTNNLKQRILKHNKSGICQILYTKEFNTGTDAFLIEQQIKRTFGGKFVDNTILKDGWTETLPIEYLFKLMNLINQA